MGEQYVLSWRIAMFAISVVLAAFIYHVIENPIRHGRLLTLKGSLLRGYASLLVVTIAMFVVVSENNGLPSRFPSEVIRLASYVNDKSPPLADCAFVGQTLSDTASFCRIGRSTETPRWLIYGDSHAWAAHAAFDKWLQLKGEAGLFMYRNSCPPVIGVHVFADKGGCFAFNRSVADFLARNVDIGNVVLVSTWRQAVEARLSTSERVQLSKADSVALFDAKFSETLAYLNSVGKRVYVWEPVPGATERVPIAMARALLEDRPTGIELSRDRYRAENDFFFSALEKNRRYIALSFSPSDALCTTGRCAVAIDGNPAYFDNAHVTQSSSDFWARMMERREREAGMP